MGSDAQKASSDFRVSLLNELCHYLNRIQSPWKKFIVESKDHAKAISTILGGSQLFCALHIFGNLVEPMDPFLE